MKDEIKLSIAFLALNAGVIALVVSGYVKGGMNFGSVFDFIFKWYLLFKLVLDDSGLPWMVLESNLWSILRKIVLVEGSLLPPLNSIRRRALDRRWSRTLKMNIDDLDWHNSSQPFVEYLFRWIAINPSMLLGPSTHKMMDDLRLGAMFRRQMLMVWCRYLVGGMFHKPWYIRDRWQLFRY